MFKLKYLFLFWTLVCAFFIFFGFYTYGQIPLTSSGIIFGTGILMTPLNFIATIVFFRKDK